MIRHTRMSTACMCLQVQRLEQTHAEALSQSEQAAADLQQRLSSQAQEAAALQGLAQASQQQLQQAEQKLREAEQQLHSAKDRALQAEHRLQDASSTQAEAAEAAELEHAQVRGVSCGNHGLQIVWLYGFYLAQHPLSSAGCIDLKSGHDTLRRCAAPTGHHSQTIVAQAVWSTSP